MVQFLLSNEAALLVSLCWLGSKTQKIEGFEEGGRIGGASTNSKGLFTRVTVGGPPASGGGGVTLSILL